MAFTGAKIITAVKEKGSVDGKFGRRGRGEGRPAGELVLRIDREQEQVLGALRIKSSRSNISEEGRTMSMSCSDKLAKWAFLGLQGGLLASWVEPIFLSSIVISADPRTEGPAPLLSALARAVPGRAAAAAAEAAAAAAAAAACTAPDDGPLVKGLGPMRQEVDVAIASVVFEKCKAQSELRALAECPPLPSCSGSAPTSSSSTAAHTLEDRGKKHLGKKRLRKPTAVPSGTALNWIDALGTGMGAGPGGGDANVVLAEVTLSATGRRQGAVSKGVLTLRMRSRLCRAVLLEAAETAARMYLPRSAPMCDDAGNDPPPPAFGPHAAPVRVSEEEKKFPLENSADFSTADRPSLDPRGAAGGGSEVPPRVGLGDPPGGCGDGVRVSRIYLVLGAGGDRGVGGGGVYSRGRCPRPYWRLKNANSGYSARRAAMLSTPTFEAWLVAGREKQEFSVDEDCVVPLLAQPGAAPPRSAAAAAEAEPRRKRGSIRSRHVTSNR
ncbi:unnamed protein product [Laminaria digitata]